MLKLLAALALACAVAPARAEDHEYKPYFFGTIERAQLFMSQLAYYKVRVPANVSVMKVSIVPIYGDADCYISFEDVDYPPTDSVWALNNAGMEEMLIRRDGFEFDCPNPANCELYVMLYGYSSTDFLFAVTNFTDPTITDPTKVECAPGCQHIDLSDNICHEECNTTACLYDAGDCLTTGSYCARGCPTLWTDDGLCDEACFVAECDWDGTDCLEPGQTKGCAPHCLPRYIDDGECDAECNVPQCQYDGADCFHGHDACFWEADGRDYRGTKNTTERGTPCQAWSEQTPHQHTRTASFYPDAGLGGHNYCRNPDGEAGPWCYTTDPKERWSLCGVEAPKTCGAAPPKLREGELAPEDDGSCPHDFYARVEGACAPCSECSHGMEERIKCTTHSNRVCTPACAVTQGTRVVGTDKGALDVVKSLCGFNAFDNNDTTSIPESKLCSNHCCDAYDIASDACEYDGVHTESWASIQSTLMHAFARTCAAKEKECKAFEYGELVENRGTKYDQIDPGRSRRPRRPGDKVSVGEAMHNPLVVTLLVAFGIGVVVLGVGVAWYRKRVKATLLYASPNAPEEVLEGQAD